YVTSPSSEVRSCALPDCAGGPQKVSAWATGAGGGIATDADNVYWTAGDGIYAAPLGGGNAMKIAQTGASLLRINDAQGYYTTMDCIDRCAINGLSCTGSLVACNGGDSIHDLVIEGGKMYWTVPTEVRHCDDVTNCMNTTELFAMGGAPTGIALD